MTSKPRAANSVCARKRSALAESEWVRAGSVFRGQADEEGRPAPGLAFGPGSPAMELSNVFDDAQSQARATRLT